MICLASLRTSCANVHKRLFSVVKINPSPTPSPLRAMKRLWIDCDAGVDDAQGTAMDNRSCRGGDQVKYPPHPHLSSSAHPAIMLALAADNTEVVGISTVHGNVVCAMCVF